MSCWLTLLTPRVEICSLVHRCHADMLNSFSTLRDGDPVSHPITTTLNFSLPKCVHTFWELNEQHVHTFPLIWLSTVSSHLILNVIPYSMMDIQLIRNFPRTASRFIIVFTHGKSLKPNPTVLIGTLMFGACAMLIPQELSPAMGKQFNMSWRCHIMVPLKVSSLRLIPCSVHDTHWALNIYRLPSLSLLIVLYGLVTSLSPCCCRNTSRHFHWTESWLALICMDLWSIVLDVARFSNQFSTYHLTLLNFYYFI